MKYEKADPSESLKALKEETLGDWRFIHSVYEQYAVHLQTHLPTTKSPAESLIRLRGCTG